MARVNYKKLVAPDSLIGRYLKYCDNGETPYAYDFWTACWLISCCIGRNTVVARPASPVYLNIFCILVAESGITRKSTAVRRSVGFLRGFKPESTYLVEGKMTPEMLEFKLGQQTLLEGQAHAAIAIDELVKFLGKEGYTMAMPTLLTDLYDAPSIRSGGGTLLHGGTELRNVYINFLSASTPSWLIRAVNPDVIEGGFTSRVVFIVCETPKRSAPWPTPPDEQLKAALAAQFLQLQQDAKRYHEIGISEGALKRFQAWYRARTVHRDPFRSSFQSREDGHILRLAGILSINDNSWEIQAHHISKAITVITECREDGAKIFEGTGYNSKMVLGLDAMRDKLLSAGLGGMRQTELSQALQRYMDAAHVRAGLDIFHDLGMVQRFDGMRIGKGRPYTVWRATKQLTSTKAIDMAIERIQ